MNQEEANFWAEFESLLAPPKEIKIEYRFYYNEMGNIYCCPQLEQDYPSEGMYLVVDKATYENQGKYHVVNGVLKELDLKAGYRVKLKKSNQGYRVVAGHASILLDDSETYSNTEYYERTN